MSVLSARNVLPLATAVLSTLFLADAVPRTMLREPLAVAVAGEPDPLAQAEVQRCVAGGRQPEDCLDEAVGKSVIERAEGLARGDDAGVVR